MWKKWHEHSYMLHQPTRCAPLVARVAPSLSAVQSFPTWWSSWFRMGPTSNLKDKYICVRTFSQNFVSKTTCQQLPLVYIKICFQPSTSSDIVLWLSFRFLVMLFKCACCSFGILNCFILKMFKLKTLPCLSIIYF